MTKGMIKDALLELLQSTSYEKITVTAPVQAGRNHQSNLLSALPKY